MINNFVSKKRIIIYRLKKKMRYCEKYNRIIFKYHIRGMNIRTLRLCTIWIKFAFLLVFLSHLYIRIYLLYLLLLLYIHWPAYMLRWHFWYLIMRYLLLLWLLWLYWYGFFRTNLLLLKNILLPYLKNCKLIKKKKIK